MTFHSLRFKTSLFVATIMATALCVIAGTFVISEQQKGSAEILQNAQTLANFSTPSIYASYVQFYTHSEDFDPFKTRVQSLLELNHDIAGLTLLGINGRILFDSSELAKGRYEGSPRSLPDTATIDDLRETKTTHRSVTLPDGKPGVQVTVPINENGIGHVLSIRYLVSYDSLAKRTQGILIETAYVAVPLMVFVIIIAIPFAITLTRPIVKLTEVAEKIRGGNFEIKTGVTSKDEIGRLGRAFDDMTAQLRQTYGKLETSLEEVTKRTDQLTEEHARFTASIDSLPLGFMMTNARSEIVLANPTMTEMVGEIDAKAPNEFLKLLIEKSNDSLLQKKSIVTPELAQNGKMYRVFLSPVLVGKNTDTLAIGSAILMEDITEERILNRSKEEFFSIASHELRTPLTAIRGNTDMILNYFADTIKDPQLNEMIVDIHGSSVRLIEIVNDFLDASRLEQGKMSFKSAPFSLKDIVQTTIDEVGTIAHAKNISLTIDKSVANLLPLWADKDKTKEVIYNLIGNAIKFVEKGSITISAHTENKLAKILVTDTGRGMPLEAQQILFHKFQQATDSILTRDNTRGTGLGLYISKLLIEQMGGKIQLEESQVGKGSTFSFTLPFASPTQLKLPAPGPVIKPSEPKP